MRRTVMTVLLAAGLLLGTTEAPSGAVTRSDGALVLALPGGSFPGLDPTVSGFQNFGWAGGPSVLLTTSDRLPVACNAFGTSTGSVLSETSNGAFRLNCIAGGLTLVCNLTFARVGAVNVISGGCVLDNTVNVFNMTAAGALTWAPTDPTPPVMTYMQTGTLALVTT